MLDLISALSVFWQIPLSSIVGRDVNRDASVPPYLVTAVSMLIGGSALFFAGWRLQGIPSHQPPGLGHHPLVGSD